MSEQKKPEPLSAENADLLMGYETEPSEASPAENTVSAEDFAAEILAEMDGGVSDDQDEVEEVSDEEEAADTEEVSEEEYDELDDEDAEVSDEESEEADGSEEDSEEDDSEDHRDGEPVPEDAVVFMTEDGEPVTAKEARAGYLRQADYTRKNQALAEERNETIQARTQALGEIQKVAEALEDAEVVFSQMAGNPPDPRLRASDPGEYAAQVAEYQQRQQVIQAIRQRRVQEQQKAQRLQQENLQDIMREENRRLQERVPEWRDADVRQRELQQIADHFQREYGYTPEELGQVQDHRAMAIMRKAMMYDQLQAEGVETLESKPEGKRTKKKSRPKPKGRKNAPRDRKGRYAKDRDKVLSEQSARLSETGSVFDAAAAIETAFGDDLL